MSKLGDNIKDLREHFGMTIKDLSIKSSVGQSTISEIETGKALNPKSDTLSKIANTFNITIDVLFSKNPIEALNSSDKDKKILEISTLKIEEDFTSPEAAMAFVLKQPALAAFGGYDLDRMTDKEIVEFANELLNQLKLLGYKYKK